MGVDQFGGDRNPALIEELVDAGLITEERLDASDWQVLREVAGGWSAASDVNARGRRWSPSSSTKASRLSEPPCRTALRCGRRGAEGARLFVEGVEDTEGFAVTEDLAEAEAIVVRLEAPFEAGRGSVVAEYFHGGTLAFSDDTIARLRNYAARAPLYLAVFLERPAILGPLVDLGAPVIGEFGASDRVVLDAFAGHEPLTGTLPFDIPSSMAAVEASGEDVPFDTDAPLYRSGFGIVRNAVSLERA